MNISECESKIKEIEYDIYVKKRTYYFEKMLSECWFWVEYHKFSEKTNKIIVAEYTGGCSCDYRNYLLSICEKSEFKREWNKSEISKSLFDNLIYDLYKDEYKCDNFKLFLERLMKNER